MRRSNLLTLLVLPLLTALASPAATVVMVDNPAATTTGAWSISTSRPDFIGANYAHNAQVGGNTITWTPVLPSAGLWQVEAYWNNNINNGNDRGPASYTITHADGTAAVVADQRNANGSWAPLGIYSFAAGTGGSAKLTSPSGQFVIADAVRWVNVGQLPTVPTSKVAVTASSSIPSPVNGRIPNAAGKGYGLVDSNNDGIGDYHRRSAFGDQYNWLSNSGDRAGWIKFDLGEFQVLDGMKVWNFHAGDSTDRTNRGINLFDLYWSDSETDPGNNFAVNWNKLNTDPLSLTRAPNIDVYNTPDFLDLDNLGARWIAFDILSNHGDGSFVGLGEVQFFREVPEPLTLTGLLMGSAALAGVWRRRRSVR